MKTKIQSIKVNCHGAHYFMAISDIENKNAQFCLLLRTGYSRSLFVVAFPEWHLLIPPWHTTQHADHCDWRFNPESRRQIFT